MKIATEKPRHLIALCTSILLTTATFASDSGYDGGDENTPPITPKTKARLVAYPALFDDIAALGSQNIKIDRLIRTFIRANFKGGEPTLENLAEFRSHLASAQEREKVNAAVAAHIGKSLDIWQDHITALTSTAAPAQSALVPRRSDTSISPLSLAPVSSPPVHRRALADISNTAVSNEPDPTLLRLIRAHIAGRNARLTLPPLREDADSVTADSPASRVTTVGSASLARASIGAIPSIPDMLTYLNSRIIGQEDAMRALAVRVHRHYVSQQLNAAREEAGLDPLKKSTILICGPTGCGKTASIKALAKLMNKPFVDGDASAITPAGYKGNNLEVIFERLVAQAEEQAREHFSYGSPQYMAEVIRLAESGIILLDEIDKIAAKSNGKGGDFKDDPVQDELLKPLDGEGTEITVTRKNGHLPPTEFKFNTRKILFVASGAFPDLFELKRKETESAARAGTAATPLSFTLDDFEEAGLKAELLGRLGGSKPVVLHSLTEDNFLRILQSPKVSPVMDNLYLLEHGYGVKVRFEEDAIRLLAHRIYENGAGVRGLSTMVESLVESLIADSVRLTDSTVIIGKEYVETHLPKVVKTKKDTKPPLGTFERFILENPTPPVGMYS